LILFFAFIGGETALNVSGEMKNPQRTAPLGLLIGTVSVLVFFCLIQLSAQAVLGAELPRHTEAPLAAMGKVLTGNTGFALLIAAAMVSIFGTIHSSMLLFPRVMYAGARDKILPAYLAAVHPGFATPHMAIMSFSVAAFLVAVSGGFRQLAVLVTASMMLLYFGVALAVIKIRFSKTSGHPPFRLPGGITIPVLALIALGWFILHLRRIELIGIGIFLGAISFIYLGVKFIKPKT
jgi:amino acid transporter